MATANAKPKRNKNSHSKFLDRLFTCLDEKKHSHMLWYSNKDKTEFTVLMINKKSPLWEKGHISLFTDLDAQFKKTRPKKKYEEKVKLRFKSNIRKYKRFIKEKDTIKEGRVKTFKIYEILQRPLYVQKRYEKHFKSMTGTLGNSTSCVNVQQVNNSSHFSCLSQNLKSLENKSNMAVNNEMSIATASMGTQISDTFIVENNMTGENIGELNSDVVVNNSSSGTTSIEDTSCWMSNTFLGNNMIGQNMNISSESNIDRNNEEPNISRNNMNEEPYIGRINESQMIINEGEPMFYINIENVNRNISNEESYPNFMLSDKLKLDDTTKTMFDCFLFSTDSVYLDAANPKVNMYSDSYGDLMFNEKLLVDDGSVKTAVDGSQCNEACFLDAAYPIFLDDEEFFSRPVLY